MSHDKPVIDGVNKDLQLHPREWYLDKTKDWVDPYGMPQIYDHDGVFVVRDDFIVGSKCRFADLLMQEIKEDTIVYVQPRVGLAGVSILEAAKRYGKKVVLFMPSSKEISHHQACCIERGAIPKFRRIAAMPNLNLMAAAWAKENNAFFIPLGLKHPLVTACAARVAINIKEYLGYEPEVCFVATSTGVLVRGLQIGWPNTKFFAICVSRNMQAGELGHAEPIVEPKAFQQEEKVPVPFPTVKTYDAKAWKYAKAFSEQSPDIIPFMWNVGKEPELSDPTLPQRVKSFRKWGEIDDAY